jgi:predicted ATP-dependent protease
MNFAVISLPEFTSLIVAVGTILAGLFAFLKYQSDRSMRVMESISKEREDYMLQASIERRALITSNTASQENEREERKAMIAAFNRVAEATERAAEEAKQRNGHLGEQNIKIIELVASAGDSMKTAHNELLANIECLKSNVSEQHVNRQIVDHEIVNERTRRG